MELRSEQIMTQQWGDAPVKVSICCITYNHSEYLSQAMDGFLKQETSFPFEIVIHDDASTDDTQDIIKEYQRKYPNIIKPLLQTENQRSKFKSGMNPRFNYPRAKGKYVAVCDGDDFWTDPTKLQKQADFLDKNEQYIACYHGCKHINANGEVIKDSRFARYASPTGRKMMIGQGALITHTVMFRNIIQNGYPKVFDGVPSGDTILYHLLGFHGDAKFLDTIEYSSYRIHDQGVFSGLKMSKRMANTLKTMSAIRTNLRQHFEEDNNILTEQLEAVRNNTNSYLYKTLSEKKISVYFKLIGTILKQNSFSKFYLLKEHFIDLLRRIFKR